jgi:FtsP/CotA-like multicopper oxidase with cupredoxin domain
MHAYMHTYTHNSSPSSTNLHTHGLHISGEGFADNVFNTVEPGASFTHIYAIPCDHPGGTYWYHAHKHGSVNLQVAGGAAGLLIIKDNPTYEVPQQTTSFKSMPVKEFVLARVTPAETRGTAFDSSDELYKSTAQDNHWLLNGCVYGATTINANQWTRLRFVYVGGQSSGVLTFKPDPTAGGATCK